MGFGSWLGDLHRPSVGEAEGLGMSDYPGFTPIRVGDQPQEKEPKPLCAVEDCTRVVYKSVVCRKHWNEIPLEVRLRRSVDATTAAIAATAASDLEILASLEAK